MSTAATTPPVGIAPQPLKWHVWAGRVLTGLPALAMLASSLGKLSHAPAVMEGFTGKFGYSAGAVTGIGVLELACAIIYVVPRTAVLGAILVTGYLGGAVATHVRIGDPSFVMPALLGVFAWAGLYLRDPRVRALLPLR
jgi:hypothetical protein